MRLARCLALAGIDSRRKCEVLIKNGAVAVNGQVVRNVATEVDPDKDDILYRGRPLSVEQKIYYVLNKPEGYTTTADDPYNKKTVYDLLPSRLCARTARPSPAKVRVFPVGRLDKDSMGLLLFTNDGELANRLTHPRYEVGKWYEVKLGRAFDGRDNKKILEGVRLEDGIAKADKIQRMSPRIIRLLIREGRNREVRRIFDALGYEVVRLCRIAFGSLALGNLIPGHGRFLGKEEVKVLKKDAHVDDK